MEDQLISFETAVLAKEKGFDEVCSYLYENCKDIVYTTHKNSGLNKHFDWYSAPTQSLLQRWLREVHCLELIISSNLIGYGSIIYDRKNHKNITNTVVCQKYEEALEEGLLQALNLIESK